MNSNNVFFQHSSVNDEQEGISDQHADRGNVMDRVVGQFGVRGGCDGMRGRHNHDREAIGSRFGDRIGTYNSAGA